ncbi:MAG TPA: chemotaxis protein CheB [Ohtaekwangia sp.]|nr:chemotaxis protein CheB [Ohtaekwangia sp.]
MQYQAIVIGTSAGGLHVLTALFEVLPRDYPIPVIVTQHRANEQTDLLEEVLQYKCKIQIKQADEKEHIVSGRIYTAPAGYHLLIERNRIFSLASDVPVKFSMPSIDVLFESAAVAYKNTLIGIILTGANDDGAAGIQRIKEVQGMTIAQDPAEAQFPTMPKAAIATGKIDAVWKINAIRKFLLELPLQIKDGKL